MKRELFKINIDQSVLDTFYSKLVNANISLCYVRCCQAGTGMRTVYSYFQTREGLINEAFIY